MNFEQAFPASSIEATDNLDLTMDQAMSALREATIETVEVSPDFDGAVLRRHRLEMNRRSAKHWAPAAFAAFLAALAVLTFLQLVAVPATSASEGSDFAAGR